MTYKQAIQMCDAILARYSDGFTLNGDENDFFIA